jgi:hypothetical protein
MSPFKEAQPRKPKAPPETVTPKIRESARRMGLSDEMIDAAAQAGLKIASEEREPQAQGIVVPMPDEEEDWTLVSHTQVWDVPVLPEGGVPISKEDIFPGDSLRVTWMHNDAKHTIEGVAHRQDWTGDWVTEGNAWLLNGSKRPDEVIYRMGAGK